GRAETFELALRPARLECAGLVVPNVGSEMDDLKEDGDRQDGGGSHAPDAEDRPGAQPSRKTGRRIGAQTKQHPAPDRDAVQQNVSNLPDTVRNEPLKPLVGGPDEQS